MKIFGIEIHFNEQWSDLFKAKYNFSLIMIHYGNTAFHSFYIEILGVGIHFMKEFKKKR